MGLFNKLKGEFIDIIEWTDDSNDTMVYRFERYGNEIKYKAKLIVREGQSSVFINMGQLADVFKPSMYELETKNLPICQPYKAGSMVLKVHLKQRYILYLQDVLPI